MGTFNSHQLQTQIRKDILPYVRRIEQYQQEYVSGAHYPNYFFLIHEYRIGLNVARLQLVIWRDQSAADENRTYVLTYSRFNYDKFITETLDHVSQECVISKVLEVEKSFTRLNMQIFVKDLIKAQEIIKKHGGKLLYGDNDSIIATNITAECETELRGIGARILEV